MRGVYTILVTPFDPLGRVDEESLRRLVEFNLEAGVHGLGIALGSEIFRLSEEERRQVTWIVVTQTRGRVPVVVNTGASGTDLAVLYSRMAQDDGADALMVMPPTFVPTTGDETCEYFEAIGREVPLPIFLQDTPATPISPALAKRIGDVCPQASYIKVESLPLPQKVAEMVAAAGETLVVFGGAGGNAVVEELARGSQGTMPGCCQPEAFVRIWDLWQQGDRPGAMAVFTQFILPFNRFACQGWGAFYYSSKELLRRRGVIASTTVRGPLTLPDAQTRRELDELLETLYP